MTIAILPLVLILTVTTTLVAAEDSGVIFDMETVRHKMGEITNAAKQKAPAGTVESVAGKFGKAVKFSFVQGASGGFATASIRTTPEWKGSAGFSFWVKGDGSAAFGGIELIDGSDFKHRYAYCFPISSTEWTKVTVPWSDVIPELSSPIVDANRGYDPSNFGNFWFGKWFHWREYPAHSYAIDHVVLEKTIDLPPIPEAPPGLTRVRAKVKERKRVTIVTMGDSLTDTRHWANRQANWPAMLAAALKEKHGVDAKVVNPAIGGTTLSQNLITMPRWRNEASQPDLVTVFFGGNDWDNGVRGARFGEYLRLGIDRIRRQTNGSADILILTTCPAHGRWETYEELEEAARAVAREKGVTVVDVAGAFRRAGGSPDEALKRGYWVDDKVHLGPRGHELVRDLVLEALVEP